MLFKYKVGYRHNESRWSLKQNANKLADSFSLLRLEGEWESYDQQRLDEGRFLCLLWFQLSSTHHAHTYTHGSSVTTKLIHT